ncbi:MAG: hypothetical protein J0M09_03460 [Xanthomonadales bacterium]|nr:hypothetical protein [Xanthomonadales bacterium]
MRTLLAIFLLLAAVPLAHAGGKKLQQTPGTLTRTFLDNYGHDVALMEVKRIDKMRAVFSKQLSATLRAVRIAQDALAAEQPDDKPGVAGAGVGAGIAELGFNSGEGHAFDSYDVRLTNMLGKNRAAVDVEFVANVQGTPVRWRDRYEWVLEGSTWKLDDIVFRSTGRPNPRERRLTKLLRPSPAPVNRLFPERPPVKAGPSR